MTTGRPPALHLSKHRIEALTDGIYAVAMTLLVIDLRLPERGTITTQGELIAHVVQLRPQFVAWVISFLVLSLFWLGHHRHFHYVRAVDGRLIALNLVQLGLVGLLPFSSAMVGSYGAWLFAQAFYSGNMTLLALVALAIARHIHSHAQLCREPMPLGVYRAARIRMAGLIAISVAAVLIAMVVPGAGNAAFMLMAFIMPMSRRAEAA